MKTATSGFISAISDGCPYHTVKFYLLGAEIDVIVKSFNYYGILSSTDGISIGNTCSSYCEFELYNNNYNLENNEVQIKVGVEVNGSIEYVSLGYFIVKNQVKQDNIIKYTAFDRMIKLEDKYSPSSVSNLTTVSIINDMCSQLGFEFENTLDAISVTKSIVGYTYREMFGFISALHGANCIFNDSGKLEFVWFTQPSSDLATIDESVMYENGLELTSNSSFKVKYLKCATGETIENTTTDENGEETTETTDVILSVGSGTTGITLSNPLMTQEILTNIYNTYFFNFEYQPCTVKRLGNILLEVGDIVTVNLGTKSYSVPIMTIQHSIDGGVITDLVSLAETETEQSISYESPTQRYIAQSVGTQIQELSANMVTTDYIASNYAKINLANITKGCIENAMIKDATISDAKIVELTANKISAGTLSCDRLLFNGSDKSIVYYLNNMGDLTSEEVNTINGDTLTDRTITADKIVANSISANEIDVFDLFAQNITATGTITGLKVDAGEITGTTINGGSLFIGNSNGTYASIDSTGKLTCSNAKIKGEITATSLTLEDGALSIDASNVSGLSSVATSGSYDDLSGKPYIPPAVDTTDFIRVGDSIVLGNSNPRDGVTGFTVSSSGLLTASNALIYGTLYSGVVDGGTVKGANINGSNINFLTSDGNSTISSIYQDGNYTQWSGYDGTSLSLSGFRTLELSSSVSLFISSGDISISGDTSIDNSLSVSSTLSATSNITTGGGFGMTSSYSSKTAPVYCKWRDNTNHDMLVRSTDGLTVNLGWAGSNSYKTVTNLRGTSIKCNGSTSWTSDENLKKDFNNFDDRYDILFDNLKPITYKYVLGTSDRFHSGFKSQDVENALEIAQLTTQEFGGVVIQPINERETERDDNGNEVDIEFSESNYLLDKGINEQHNLAYIEFIALNTWQIQKLKSKVKEQQNEIDELKQTVQSLIEGVQK